MSTALIVIHVLAIAVLLAYCIGTPIWEAWRMDKGENPW